MSIVIPYLQTKSFKKTMISRFVKIVSNQCLVFRLFNSIKIVKKREEDGEFKLIFIDTRNVLKKKRNLATRILWAWVIQNRIYQFRK